MSRQNHPTEYSSTDKITWTSTQAAEAIMRIDADPNYLHPDAGRMIWPSQLAENLPQQTSERPNAARMIWPSQLAENIRQKTSQRTITSPLPAPLAQKGRPTPLDLEPWERYKHRDLELSPAVAVGLGINIPEIADEDMDHEASEYDSIEPAPSKLPEDIDESSESSSDAPLPKQPRNNKPGTACVGCKKSKKKCSGDRPVCSSCEKLEEECAYDAPRPHDGNRRTVRELREAMESRDIRPAPPAGESEE